MKQGLLLSWLVFWLLALSPPVFAEEPIELPDLGGTSTRLLSVEEEQTFARDFRRFLRAQNLLIEDPMIQDYFEDMGFRMVSHSTRRDRQFHFLVLRDPNINAFATVAGVVALHSGLILMAHDASEVAGVVAHEVAHVTQDHLARGAENQQQVSLPTMLATLALAIAASRAGGSDAGQAVLLSGLGLAQQFQINYTRQSEAEADRIGIQLLAQSGYDPRGMTRFFERLNIRSRAMGQGVPEYLRTHPLTINRIAEARSRADAVDRGLRREEQEFHFIQSRLRVLLSNYHDQTLTWFETRLGNAERPPEAMRYGIVLTLIRDRQFERAKREIQPLLQSDTDNPIFRLLEAELMMADGRQEQALTTLNRLYRAFPGSRYVITQYADALMQSDDPADAQQASDILRDYLHRHVDDLRMTELYAQAANRTGQSVRAAEAIADSYYLRGGISEAIEQLERVVKRDDLNYYQRARISARLSELRSEQIRSNAQTR